MATTQARRVAHHGPRRAVAQVVPTSQDDTTITLIKQGIAAAAVASLGVGLVGAVSLSAAAQATETAGQTSTTGHGQSNYAIPEPKKPEAASQALGDDTANKPDSDPAGSLDAFPRTSSDTSSRNAVRAEIDRALASQKAKERGATLEVTNTKADESSHNAVNDARTKNLTNLNEARKREQARSGNERRKVEETIKSGTLPPDAMPFPVSGVAGVGGAVKPVGNYVRGAGWGAVGSWSRYHTGVDLAAPVGTPVTAAAPGVVVSPNAGAWAGNHVIIRHNDGTSTLYAHMAATYVRPGQQVGGGQQIGIVGLTGRTFGPHLHFEHYPAGASTSNPYTTDDPYRWMMAQGVRL